MVIPNSDKFHKIIDKYGSRYILAVKLSKFSSFIILVKNMHQIVVSHPFNSLDGGRKSFELPCIYLPRFMLERKKFTRLYKLFLDIFRYFAPI